MESDRPAPGPFSLNASKLLKASRESGNNWKAKRGLPIRDNSEVKDEPSQLLSSASHNIVNEVKEATADVVASPSARLVPGSTTPEKAPANETQEKDDLFTSPWSSNQPNTPDEPWSWKDVLLLKSLSWQEKSLVVSFLLAAIYVNFSSWSLRSIALGAVSMQEKLLAGLYSVHVSREDWTRLCLALLAGVCLDLSWDYYTAITDEHIVYSYRKASAALAHVQAFILRNYEQSHQTVQLTVGTIVTICTTTEQTISKVPRVIYYMIAILIGILSLRYMLNKTTKIAVQTASVAWPYLSVCLGFCAVLGIAFLFIRKQLLARYRRQEAVGSVVYAMKKALEYYNAPYSADDMKEDIEHFLHSNSNSSSKNTKKTLTSPSRLPANIISTVISWVGGESNVLRVELPEEVREIYTEINMQGLKLDEIWADVMTACKRDRQISINDMKQGAGFRKCLRLLK